MKKIKIISYIIALIVAASLFTACIGKGNTGKNNVGKSNIEYGEWKVTTEATCEEVGFETRTAINDETIKQTRPIPAHGHKYGEWVVELEPTATEKGLKKAYCIYCNTDFIKETIPALGGGSAVQPIPEPPAIPEDGEGIFVLGGYSRFITEERIYAIVKDFDAYCNENAIARKFIGWRMYDDATVAGLGQQIISDNYKIDILLGGGNNINTTGGLSEAVVNAHPGNSYAKVSGQKIYFDGAVSANRAHLRLSGDQLALEFWTYIISDRAVAILTAEA